MYYYISSFTNNGNGILQVSKMEGKLQCAPACHRSMVARRPAAAAASPAVPISTMEFSHPLSAALHQIFYASQLQVSTWRFGLPAAGCYLLQMFKVSLFIIYTATVLDFVEVEHYIHNQAHNGYSHGLRTPNECINQRNL